VHAPANLQVPWAHELRAALTAHVQWANAALADRFINIMASRLCASTLGPYDSKLRKFVRFCESHDHCPLPATTAAIFEYLAFLSLEGAVKPQLWMQYIAVINSMHKDVGLPRPWMEDGLCQQFVHSACKLHTAQAPAHPAKVPLLARHVLQFLATALHARDVQVVRAALAVGFAFTTFVRGASITSLACHDVIVSDVGFSVRVWDEKTRKGSGLSRPITIDIREAPVLGQVALKFSCMQSIAWAAGAGGPQGFFQLPGDTHPLPPGFLNDCMQVCVQHNQAACGDVYGSNLTGHCCRSGGVSCLHALGGSVLVAADRGGWACLQTMVQHYLFVDVQPDLASFQLLGFLLPPATRAVARQIYLPAV
jgi:hypothetical protein